MSKYKNIIIGVALLGLVGMAIFSYRVYSTFFSPNTGFENDTYEVFIGSDMDYKEAYLLIADAVEDRDAFHETAVKKGYHDNVRAGHFIIEKGMSNNDIINSIRSRNVPVKVRFNNQERLEDLAGRLAVQLEPDSLSFINAMRDKKLLAQFDLSKEQALALYLPNQYESYWNTSATNFIEKMAAQYERFWTADRMAKAKKLNMTAAQVYTLASIVHKETAQKEERPKVAGVYINRLKNSIKLDADPTVIYAIKKENNNFNQVIKRVLYKHLESTNKYNTYKYAGLPPGPIVTPDLDAIDAVLNYEKHSYYYFVASIENFGYHKFAKTLAQHNANAAAYRRWIARQ